MTPVHYHRIRVQGQLRPEWSEWLDGLDIAHDAGDTVLSGSLSDQPALYGLLIKLRDLGLTLLTVETNGRNAESTATQ